MKTFCVVAVVLSLTAVCQAAPLSCEKHVKPVDKSPDWSGTYYLQAMSMKSCLAPTLVNSFIWPSVEVTITSLATTNTYHAKYKARMHGHCYYESEDFLYENNLTFDLDDNTRSVKGNVLLQTCHDCIAVRRSNYGLLLLYSRRKTVTAAELKEFETQAECLTFSKPQVLNSDYVDGGCLPLDEIDAINLSVAFLERLKDTYVVQLKCLADAFLFQPDRTFQQFQQWWNLLWW